MSAKTVDFDAFTGQIIYRFEDLHHAREVSAMLRSAAVSLTLGKGQGYVSDVGWWDDADQIDRCIRIIEEERDNDR